MANDLAATAGITPCQHFNFFSTVTINRVEDVGRFMADVSIKCADCNQEFAFVGLPGGLNFDRPTASFDRLTARLPIFPQDRPPPPIPGVKGFTINPIS